MLRLSRRKEKIMAGPSRVVRSVGLVVGTAGILLASIGVWLLADTWSFNATARRAEGIVTRIEWGEYRPNQRLATIYAFVEFQDEGRVVEFRTQSTSSSVPHFVGEKVTVLYQSGRAEQARIHSFFGQYLLAIILGFLGIIFGAISSLLLLIPIQRGRRRRLAMTTGTPVKATIIEVRNDLSMSVNGRNPWVIVAEHRDENLSRNVTFTSEYLWVSPEKYYPVASEVTVYYLPQQPSICAFVLDKIPGGR
jgi:hypothetical protein